MPAATDTAADPATDTATFIDWLHPTGTVELRAIRRDGGPPRSAVFGPDERDDAAHWVGVSNATGHNVYCTLNPVPDGLTGSAKDADVLARRNLLIDVDPVRPADCNATDAEKTAAIEVATRVRDFLTSRGWPQPLQLDSGNGRHLIYAVDLGADDGGLTRDFLRGLAAKFDTPGATIDRRVFNASRITKLAGTEASKSVSPTPDRPARVARLIDAPPRVVVPVGLIRSTGAELAPPGVNEPKREDITAVRPADRREVLDRARAYLSEVDPAVSGEAANPTAGNHRHGHDQAFHAACLLVLGFGLTVDEALPPIREWSERCSPPWSDEELRHKLADADKRGGERGYLLTDLTPAAWNTPQRLAERVCAEHELRFIKDTALRYDGKKWAVVSDRSLRATVHRVCEAAAQRELERVQRARAGERERLDDKARRLRAHPEYAEADGAKLDRERVKLDKQPPPALPPVTESLVTNVIGAVRARRQLPDATRFDSWLSGSDRGPVLAVGNGLFDTRTRELRPHSPDWFSLTALPVHYDPKATCPKWVALVDELMEGDAERVAVLQEVMGACLDQHLRMKFFAAFVGRGDNGKSVALVVLRALLGAENCCAVELSQLSSNRFAAYAVLGKLANVVGDQGFFESRDEGQIKTLTGGDLMQFESKGRDPIHAVNTAKLVFAANDAPTFSDKSDAIWSRAVLVPFSYTVPPGKKDPALLDPATWAAELAGVLNWALAGLARLHANRAFTASAACEALKADHRKNSNPARDYLHSACEAGGEDDFVVTDDLFADYLAWLQANGFDRRLTKPKFGREIPATFPAAKSGQRRQGGSPKCGWSGVRKRPAPV